MLPKGIRLGKTDAEINKMTYETMLECLKMVDFERASKEFKEGKYLK
nr:hypothetical protein [Ruminococcus sp. 1001270H_150608_F2]